MVTIILLSLYKRLEYEQSKVNLFDSFPSLDRVNADGPRNYADASVLEIRDIWSLFIIRNVFGRFVSVTRRARNIYCGSVSARELKVIYEVRTESVNLVNRSGFTRGKPATDDS